MYKVLETNEDNKIVEHVALGTYESIEEARAFLEYYISKLASTGDVDILQCDIEEGFANYLNVISNTSVKVEIVEEDDYDE